MQISIQNGTDTTADKTNQQYSLQAASFIKACMPPHLQPPDPTNEAHWLPMSMCCFLLSTPRKIQDNT